VMKLGELLYYPIIIYIDIGQVQKFRLLRLYLIIYIAIKQAELYSLTKEQAEKEKLLNNQLNAILDNMPFMAWLKDKEGSLMAVNEQFARMCNTTVEDILGKTDLDFFPRKYAEEYREEDLEVMRRKQTRSREEPIIGPDGVKWYETFKSPVFDKDGNVIGTAGFSRDISERKKVEQMKDEFVSTVSHELRTPLTSIKGALGLLLSGVMGELPVCAVVVGGEHPAHAGPDTAVVRQCSYQSVLSVIVDICDVLVFHVVLSGEGR